MDDMQYMTTPPGVQLHEPETSDDNGFTDGLVEAVKKLRPGQSQRCRENPPRRNWLANFIEEHREDIIYWMSVCSLSVGVGWWIHPAAIFVTVGLSGFLFCYILTLATAAAAHERISPSDATAGQSGEPESVAD